MSDKNLVPLKKVYDLNIIVEVIKDFHDIYTDDHLLEDELFENN